MTRWCPDHASTPEAPAQCSSCCTSSLASLRPGAVCQQAGLAKLLLGDGAPIPCTTGQGVQRWHLRKPAPWRDAMQRHVIRIPAQGYMPARHQHRHVVVWHGCQHCRPVAHVHAAGQPFVCCPGGRADGEGTVQSAGGTADSLRAGTCNCPYSTILEDTLAGPTLQHACSLLISCCFALAGLAPLQGCPAGAGVQFDMLLPQARLIVLPCSTSEALFVHVALTGNQPTDDWSLLKLPTT